MALKLYKKGEGIVKRHIDVSPASSDYQLLEIIAKEKANRGDTVEILPMGDNPADPPSQGNDI